MSAKQTAFKDIQDYLTPIANSEDHMQKHLNRKWYRFSHCYGYDFDRGFAMRISHFKNLLN